MRLYNSIGPNPHVVRMFAAEKGVSLDLVTVDLMKGENRQDSHLKRNPAGQMPALETDGGQFISEITAICEYIEDKHPTPALIGTTPEEKAETRMWVRRFDENVIWPLTFGFRYAEGVPLFTGRIPVFPEAAPHLKAQAKDRTAWFDKLIEGREWIAGDRLTLADILAFCFLTFGGAVGQPLDPANKNLMGIIAKLKDHASAKA